MSAVVVRRSNSCARVPSYRAKKCAFRRARGLIGACFFSAAFSRLAFAFSLSRFPFPRKRESPEPPAGLRFSQPFFWPGARCARRGAARSARGKQSGNCKPGVYTECVIAQFTPADLPIMPILSRSSDVHLAHALGAILTRSPRENRPAGLTFPLNRGMLSFRSPCRSHSCGLPARVSTVGRLPLGIVPGGNYFLRVPGQIFTPDTRARRPY